jgi:hypothetical protein
MGNFTLKVLILPKKSDFSCVRPPSLMTKTSAKQDKHKNLEKIVKILCGVLTNSGYVVRREELKRGFGWKVVSGSCRLNDDKLVFVDRKLTLEDQVVFLTNSITHRGVQIPQENIQELNDLGWHPVQQDAA